MVSKELKNLLFARETVKSFCLWRRENRHSILFQLFKTPFNICFYFTVQCFFHKHQHSLFLGVAYSVSLLFVWHQVWLWTATPISRRPSVVTLTSSCIDSWWPPSRQRRTQQPAKPWLPTRTWRSWRTRSTTGTEWVPFFQPYIAYWSPKVFGHLGVSSVSCVGSSASTEAVHRALPVPLLQRQGPSDRWAVCIWCCDLCYQGQRHAGFCSSVRPRPSCITTYTSHRCRAVVTLLEW